MFGQNVRPERKSLTGSTNAFIYREQNGELRFASEAGEKRVEDFRTLSDIQLSHQNSWLAIGLGAGGIRVGSPDSGLNTRLALGMHSPQIAFSPDENFLVATFGGSYKVWNTGQWTLYGESPRVPYHDAPGAVAFSPDSKYLAVAESPKRIKLINLLSMREELTIDSPTDHLRITSLSLAENGETLAAAYNDGIEVWNIDQMRIWLEGAGLLDFSE